MIAQELIQLDLKPLTPTDTVGDALQVMEVNGLEHFPVVTEEVYSGLLSEDTALDLDESTSISELEQLLLTAHVDEGQHLFDAIRRYGEQRISILPVVDEEKHYLGYLKPQDILQTIGGFFSIQAPGSMLVVEIAQVDYSMAQVAQIVESNDAKILASYINARAGSDTFEITLRLNFDDINSIIAAFERYNYRVVQAWHKDRYQEDLKERFNQFMNYLNM